MAPASHQYWGHAGKTSNFKIQTSENIQTSNFNGEWSARQAFQKLVVPRAVNAANPEFQAKACSNIISGYRLVKFDLN